MSRLLLAVFLLFALNACGSSDGTGNPVPPENIILDLVNEVRSQPQQCSANYMPAAPPLIWDDRLGAAAQLHSEYMAESNVMTHTGRNGSSFTERISAQSYGSVAATENIAAGYQSHASVLAGWLDSPGHCRIPDESEFH